MTTTPNYGVTVAGDRAYVARGLSGLQVIDVSNPATPVCLADFTTDGEAYDVKVAGNLDYVACACGGLQIISIAPSNPPVMAIERTQDSLVLKASELNSGGRYRVESSDTMMDWSPWTNVIGQTEPMSIPLPLASSPAKFYRMIQE